MTLTAAPTARPDRPADAYARLEERILSRDQIGASAAIVDLVKEGRPLPELLEETVRIHGPYTHVPFHQRLDDRTVKFVNNDHCMLSVDATLRLARHMPRALEHLPIMQTVWYLPTGLDPWNQLLGKAPGHYTRMYKLDVTAEPPPPAVHWPDQEPLYLDGSLDERLNEWLTRVQRCDVITAYRIFLGLLEDPAARERALAELVFAGLIDVQDRMLFNRSYTTGHKAYRARATVELGDLAGWDRAHPIVYAGVPDLGVGPHWYSTYEMATNVCVNLLEGQDHAMLANTGLLSPEEQRALEDIILHSYEPAWQHHLVQLLKDGKSVRAILDVVHLAAAQLILECGAAENYSMPQHSAEYCATLRWYFDRFDHPHQVKLLFIAAAMVNQAAHHQAADAANAAPRISEIRAASGRSPAVLLGDLEEALLARNTDEALSLTATYLKNQFDRAPLVQLLAVDSTKFGNDPHNQEIGLSLVEDYDRTTAIDRDRLLLACAKHITGYRKYGDPLEAFQRYASAFGVV